MTRLTSYVFFLILTAVVSVFLGNKRSSTDDPSPLINLTPEIAQADIVPIDGGVDAGCADTGDSGGSCSAGCGDGGGCGGSCGCSD